MTALLCFVVSFLIGSIPWGVIVSRLFYNKDVRDSGSGNIGFTNSMRSLGKVGGGAVFLLDFAKGLVAVLLAKYLFGETYLTVAIATFASVSGHIFCPWLKFKGGKGISTAFGASFVAMSVPVALGLFAVFLLIVLTTKYVSAGSITAAICYPFAGIFTSQDSPQTWVFYFLVAIMVIWAHRENISRIKSGTEHKIKS